MTQVSKKERVYKLIDEYSLETVLLMLITGLVVGFGVFLLLDSAENPSDKVNFTQLNQDYRDATCVPPYRDKTCYPVTSDEKPVNSSVNKTGGMVAG